MAKAVSAKLKSEILASFDGVVAEVKAEIEANAAEATAAWKKDLERQKEEDQYAFNKSKRDREDALEQQLKARVASVEEREAAVKARAADLAIAEEKLEELQAEVAEIPSRIEAAKTDGYRKGYNAAKSEADADARIKEAEVKADQRVFAGQLESLRSTVDQSEATIASLRSELQAANARVSEIATNAVTAAGQSKVTVQTATNGK